MANRRIFQLQRLTSNGVVIGGAGRLSVELGYRDVIRSRGDGAGGVEDVDRAGLRGTVTLETTDITKLVALMNAVVGDTVFSARESGAATYRNYTMPGIVWTGASLRLPKAEDASMTLTGVIRFSDSTHKMANVIAVAGAAVSPTNAHHAPARTYRPHTASFDPNGAAAAIAPLHTQDLSLDLAFRVLEDYADTDVGHTAVDRAEPEPVRVTITHRDANPAAPSHLAAALADAVAGVLTVTLLGRGGIASKTLTVRNLLWLTMGEQHGQDYTDYSHGGEAAWLLRGSPDTVYTLGGATPLFDIT